MNPAMTQIDLVTGIIRVLEDAGITDLLPRQFNAIIVAADSVMAELREPEREVAVGMGLAAWLRSDHTGLSSLFVAKTLCGLTMRHRGDLAWYAYPSDCADFGRCLGLLDAVPELRERLPEMAETGNEWAALVPFWDDLEAAFEAGQFEVVTDQIRRLTCPSK